MGGKSGPASERRTWPTFVIQVDPALIFEQELQQLGERITANGLGEFIGMQFEEGVGVFLIVRAATPEAALAVVELTDRKGVLRITTV